ncbi:MAG: signal recognition particle-docking protein FtsY [Proteobacteria bacterium]|nr:MAG: signal recognition particle-docking protein FtsY [Pseudomonadota bacterium]
MNDQILILIGVFALLCIALVLFLLTRPGGPLGKPSDIPQEKKPEELSAPEATPPAAPEAELQPVLKKNVPLSPSAAPRAPVLAPEPAAAPAAKKPAPWEIALKKSREPLLQRLRGTFQELTSSQAWNDSHPIWESMEETLLSADLGPSMTERLLEALKKDFREKPEEATLKQHLRDKMLAVFEAVPPPALPTEVKPFVTILIGVNGAGKTTTAGKLAAQAKANGKLVVLGAGDTFRAAAVEQLQTWADRIGVECIVPAKGANPAAVAFDTVAAGLSRGADEIIIDTAGRLHTKDNLMDELKKVVRVIDKKLPGAPHRVLLVLDATLGQNALAQAKEFTSAVAATGVVLTKLDGSAKGGAAFAVSADLSLPVAFVGIGEGVEDLRTFSSRDFVQNLIP